jgi:hypothetical protein
MLRIKVRAPKPSLTVVRAPASASAHARRIRIAVASNVPATLTITHARHTVGPRLRTITIRLRPGRSTLRFAYTLRSPGGTVRGIYDRLTPRVSSLSCSGRALRGRRREAIGAQQHRDESERPARNAEEQQR